MAVSYRGDIIKKRDRALLFVAVKRAIDEWNPYGLLPEAVSNEFDRESKAIASKISQNDTVDDIAKIISTIFSSSFESKGFSKRECIDVAKEIKYKISNINQSEVG